jgi:hypothetical protein
MNILQLIPTPTMQFANKINEIGEQKLYNFPHIRLLI